MKKKLTLVILLFITSYSISAQALKFEELSEVIKLKRGKEYNIKWSGGLADQMIKIELHNRSGKIQSWDETQNDGEHVLKLNPKLKPGKGYVFRISVAGEEVSSQGVQIIRKIPLALTISTAIVVPAVVLLISTKDEGGKLIDPTPPD
jgi:hypothetical protein